MEIDNKNVDLTTMPLVKIINEMSSVSKYQDELMVLAKHYKTDASRLSIFKEYDKAEEYLQALNEEIKRRWGIDILEIEKENDANGNSNTNGGRNPR